MTEDEIREFVRDRARDKNKSLSEISKKLGRNHAYLQQFIERKVPAKLPEDVRPVLALELECDENDLIPGVSPHRTLAEEGVRYRTSAVRRPGTLLPVDLPGASSLPKDVPVYGVTVGGQGGEFAFNGQTVDYVRRPPGLANVPNAFALYVANDSMSPWKEPGDLVYVQPGRPAKVGDYVVIEMKSIQDGEAGACLVKRLKGRSPSKLTLQQYNPPNDKLIIDTAKVKQIYRVTTLEELMGA